MKATDFNLSKEIVFNADQGVTTFKNSRLVVFDVNAIGLLRQKLIDTLDWQKARQIFLQFGFQNGYADFMQMKLAYEFDTEMDLLASGPVIHTWEGIVHAQPKELRIDRAAGDIFFTGVWSNSYEAEQHLCFNDPAQEPVCWSLMGYASGWCSAFMGRKTIAIEPVCVGMGHDRCEWKIMPEEKWGPEAEPYRRAYRDFRI